MSSKLLFFPLKFFKSQDFDQPFPSVFNSLIIMSPEVIQIPYSAALDIISSSNIVTDILKCSLCAIAKKYKL